MTTAAAPGNAFAVGDAPELESRRHSLAFRLLIPERVLNFHGRMPLVHTELADFPSCTFDHASWKLPSERELSQSKAEQDAKASRSGRPCQDTSKYESLG